MLPCTEMKRAGCVQCVNNNCPMSRKSGKTLIWKTIKNKKQSKKKITKFKKIFYVYLAAQAVHRIKFELNDTREYGLVECDGCENDFDGV